MEAATLVQETLRLAGALALPLVGAAVLAAIINAALRAFLGLDDRVLSLVVRAAFVLGAAVAIHVTAVTEIQAFAREVLGQLSAVGQTRV